MCGCCVVLVLFCLGLLSAGKWYLSAVSSLLVLLSASLIFLSHLGAFAFFLGVNSVLGPV